MENMSLSNTREEEGLRPKRSLGQNFLMHPQIAERICDAAELSINDTVLEIGPGTGMLTHVLLARVKKIIAIEADDALIEKLNETFTHEIEEGKLVLIAGDVREFDSATLTEPYKIVANIPYYITGEIIRSFLSSNNKPSSMTLLVQKEVAERIARIKKESLLSLSVKAYGTPQYCFKVPRGAFRPAPNVDSAVLHIKDISGSAFPSPDQEILFFNVLHAGFAHKRKQLGNNLEEVFSPERVADALDAAHISRTARAEDLRLESWRAIASALGRSTD